MMFFYIPHSHMPFILFHLINGQHQKIIDELCSRDSLSFPQLRIHAYPGKVRYRIELIEYNRFIFRKEEVDSCHSPAAYSFVYSCCVVTYLLCLFFTYISEYTRLAFLILILSILLFR